VCSVAARVADSALQAHTSDDHDERKRGYRIAPVLISCAALAAKIDRASSRRAAIDHASSRRDRSRFIMQRSIRLHHAAIDRADRDRALNTRRGRAP